MRWVSLILAVFITSCASKDAEENVGHLAPNDYYRSARTTQGFPGDSSRGMLPSACVTVTNAINHEDVATLQKLIKPGMLADAYPSWFRSVTNKNGSVPQMTIGYYVGKLLIVQDRVGSDGRTNKVYSFEEVNKDGTVNPHWLQITVREEGGRSELVDFWNFGW